jgi:hypothetical protein
MNASLPSVFGLSDFAIAAWLSQTDFLQFLNLQACSAWLSPQDLNPSKLAVTFLPCASEKGPQLPSPRKYTLTHSDITGQLRLSVGQEYNQVQLSGWYLQLFR